MKKLLFLILSIFLLWCANSEAACPAGVCYVRPDGGTNVQCNGGSDADVSATPNCSFSHPFYAFGWYTWGTISPPSGGQAGVMIGGDEVIIKPGSYEMGYGQTESFNCNSGYEYDCVSRPIPSGSAGNHTKILGCSASGCGQSTRPELWGTKKAAWIFDLRDKDYIDLDSLNLTDHVACGSGNQYYGCSDGVQDIIRIERAGNISMNNLWIHGSWRYGIYGGGVNDITVTDSKIDFNSFGGWDFDHCSSSIYCQNTGTLSFKGSVAPTSTTSLMSFNWNGCVEDPSNPGNAKNNGCYNGNNGGYGDGIGTGPTPGDWQFENISVSHNTTDGFDFLYLNAFGVSGGTVSIKKSLAEGNNSQQVKSSNAVTLEDNIIIGNCGFWSGKSYTPSNMSVCANLGNTVTLAWRNNSADNPKIYNNTITSNGDVMFVMDNQSSGCTAGVDILVKNNLLLGGREWANDTANNPGGENQSIAFWYNDDTSCFPEMILDYNVCTGDFKNSVNCTSTSTNNSTKQTATGNNVYDATPTDIFIGTILQGPTNYYTGTDYLDQLGIKVGSSARDVSDETLVGTDANDYYGNARGASWDAGGIEYDSEPTCGNNTQEDPEVCDGSDLPDTDCPTHNAIYSGGTLQCESNCTDYDVSLCEVTNCGNGSIDSGEDCDTTGPDLDGQDCESQGYSSGTLACTADTCLFDYSGCVSLDCQNDVVDPGEECDDGNAVEGDGCSSLCQNEINGIELFLNYTEIDPSTYLDVETHVVNLVGISHGVDATVYKDFGASYFGDFHHRFKVTVDGCVDVGYEDGGAGLWAISENYYNNLKDQEDATDGLGFSLDCKSSFEQHDWQLVIDGVEKDQFTDIFPSLVRYIDIQQVGTSLTANVYSDALYSNLLDSLTGTSSGTDYRYLYVGSSYNSGETETSFSGTVENLNLDSGTPLPGNATKSRLITGCGMAGGGMQ